MTTGEKTEIDAPPSTGGWRSTAAIPSLPEVNGSVAIPSQTGFWRKMFAFCGPGYLVAIGYMDPGNWATDIEGGAKFGYRLLSVVVFSSLIAILLQTLSARLGIATGRDLAQACRDHYSKRVSVLLWVLCEIAIIACDLAEVLGSAIALNLLFKIPLLAGVCITALDVLMVMLLQNKGFRYLEAMILGLIATMGFCFIAEIIFSHPSIAEVVDGFLPKASIITNPGMLYLSIGILGATVMPHNLFLHSSIIQTRAYVRDDRGKAEAIKFSVIDSVIALTIALLMNAAILVMSAATFHNSGHQDVAEIQDAHKLLSPLLGVGAASLLFAIALLASGQSATFTGTLAGQIVMEGFLNLKLSPWLRRLVTRSLSIVPAVICIGMYGDKGVGKLIVLSQVILSMQLPFAIVPLLIFTSDSRKMGRFVNPRWITVTAWAMTILITALNIKGILDWLGITH